MGLVHKLIQPNLGFDGEDDDLSAKEILWMKYKECFPNFYSNANIGELLITGEDIIDIFST